MSREVKNQTQTSEYPVCVHVVCVCVCVCVRARLYYTHNQESTSRRMDVQDTGVSRQEL